MVRRLLSVLILLSITAQAQAERFASSYGQDDFLGLVATGDNEPPPGIEAPTIVKFPNDKVPLPRPRPNTKTGLLPGMIDPDAPPADRNMKYPIWKPFLKRFNACAPGCRPINYRSQDSRGDGVSCHISGKAIDVHGMRCNDGKVYLAIQSKENSGRFAELVNCMVGGKPRGHNLRKKGVLGGLWHNGSGVTDGHKDHAHFSIGCGGYW